MIKAHGKTYESIDEAREAVATLREDNDRYGESDGRVTEINAILAAIAEAPRATSPRETVVVEDGADRWSVVFQTFPSPCDHPQCALLHRRFFTGSEYDWMDYEDPRTGETRSVKVRGNHEKTNREWIILLNGERVGMPWDTKRDAVAEALTRPTI